MHTGNCVERESVVENVVDGVNIARRGQEVVENAQIPVVHQVAGVEGQMIATEGGVDDRQWKVEPNYVGTNIVGSWRRIEESYVAHIRSCGKRGAASRSTSRWR